jgi:hypothetical protein
MCIGSAGQYSQSHVLTTSQMPNEGFRLFPDKSHVSHGAAPRYAHEADETRLTYRLVIPCTKNIYCAFPIFDLAPRFGSMVRLFHKIAGCDPQQFRAAAFVSRFQAASLSSPYS